MKFLFIVIVFLVFIGCDDSKTSYENCGDGIIDIGEECDDVNIAESQCTDHGFYYGSVSCSPYCTFDLSNCSNSCGDGTLDNSEQCDGDKFGGITCTSIGYNGGELSCTDGCVFELTDCKSFGRCGDDTIQEDIEDCEADNLDGKSCVDIGFDGGTLHCNEDCSFDNTHCIHVGCGDNIKSGLEECDGEDFGDSSCLSEDFYGGEILCTDNCMLDTSLCEAFGWCGDSEINGTEECDNTDVNDETCLGLGYHGGELTCNDDCTYDKADCISFGECGDGNVQHPETCDGTNIVDSCSSLGYYGGTIDCNIDCTLNVTDCQSNGICGDGNIDENFSEDCDGSNIDTSCIGLGYHGGTLGCTDCSFDLTDCLNYGKCGDNTVNSTYEQCDNEEMGANENCEDNSSEDYYNGIFSPSCTTSCTVNWSSCPSNGYCGDAARQSAYEDCDSSIPSGVSCNSEIPGSTGTISCNGDCTLNTSLCTGICDGVALEPGEACDGQLFSGNEDCSDYGYHPGPNDLICSSDCSVVDSSQCASNGSCGDSVLQSSYEECDATTTSACTIYGYEDGDRTCTSCQYDYSDCHNISPGIVGDSCMTIAQCDDFTGTTLSKRCMTSIDGQPVTGGYCTANCSGNTDLRCNVNGGKCMRDPYDTGYYCLKNCTTSADCTRSGYSCAVYSSAGRTYRACLPNP